MANEVRLIDANALIEYLKKLDFEGGTKTRSQAGNEVIHIHMPQIIQQAPTVDAVEVVHGRWIEGGKTRVDDVNGRILHCSKCGDYCYNFDPIPPHNYCPNCGAKMDGGNEDANKD